MPIFYERWGMVVEKLRASRWLRTRDSEGPGQKRASTASLRSIQKKHLGRPMLLGHDHESDLDLGIATVKVLTRLR